MKNILVATDFSNDAYCALFYISQLMASRPCNIYVLNVFDASTPLHGKVSKFFAGKKKLKEIEIESKENLTSTSHKIITDCENLSHRFHTISKKGVLVKKIAETIDELQIDLVVMGTKGKTGAKEIFFGSNTIEVANTITECPILAVPKQIDYKTPKEISFVTDFKKGCSKETISPLLYLARVSEASIRVMHIAEEEILTKEQESQKKLVELCLKDVDHSFHSVQDFDDKAQLVDTFLEKHEIDMFAMVHHKRGFFEKLVHEPVIKDVSIYAEIPFLILSDQD